MSSGEWGWLLQCQLWGAWAIWRMPPWAPSLEAKGVEKQSGVGFCVDSMQLVYPGLLGWGQVWNKEAEAGMKPSQLGLVHWCPEIRKIKNVNLTCQTVRLRATTGSSAPSDFKSEKYTLFLKRPRSPVEDFRQRAASGNSVHHKPLSRLSKAVRGSEIGLLTPFSSSLTSFIGR